MKKNLLLAVTLLLSSITAHAGSDTVQSSLYQFQMRMAQQGSTEAAFLVGEMNEEGRGTTKNLPEAISWYRKAAEKGHPEASKKLQGLEQKSL